MPAVRLARDHVSRAGAPVVHSVDPAIFSLRYFMRCMACGFCHDQCCDHGVDVDIENVKRLLALGPEFQARVTVSPTEWFTKKVVRDTEFPTGSYVRTQVRNGKCVFISQSGRGCTIHAFCLEKKIDYHTLKPMVSALFPVTFDHGILVPSSEAVDGSLICSGEGATLYDGVRGELAYYFGDELVSELDDLRVSLDRLDT
ncbi:MAG: YkgJ family cysteine cluster protein [Gemmatimonadaceae bacterium]